MNTLHIHLNTDGSLTTIERRYNEDAKYVETFPTWTELFNTLLQWMDSYAWIEVQLS